MVGCLRKHAGRLLRQEDKSTTRSVSRVQRLNSDAAAIYIRELRRLPGGALGASSDYKPARIGVQRSEVENGRHMTDEAARQRTVPGVQGGAEAE